MNRIEFDLSEARVDEAEQDDDGDDDGSDEAEQDVDGGHDDGSLDAGKQAGDGVEHAADAESPAGAGEV